MDYDENRNDLREWIEYNIYGIGSRQNESSLSFF